MDFRDQLNKNTRTPQEAEAEKQRLMYSQARYEYGKIKESFLFMAKHGEYTVENNKKCIIYYHYLKSYRYTKEDEITTIERIGLLGSRTKTTTRRRIVIDESKRKEYESFIASIQEIAANDGMKIVPIVYNQKENKEFSIPTPILGIYIWGYEFCLKCTMVY